MAANQGARGERTFQAGERTVTVLFTNRALVGAEKRLGKGVIGVAEGLLSGATGLSEVAVLLHVGMEAARLDARAGGRQVSMDEAYEVLDAGGFGTVAAEVLKAVSAVLSYTAEPNIVEGVASGLDTDPNA